MEKHTLSLFFDLGTLNEMMDYMDLSDNGKKVFCRIFPIEFTTKKDWTLTSDNVEKIEKAFLSSFEKTAGALSLVGGLCAIYDEDNNVFYNFTKDKTMFSNGSAFTFQNTKEVLKTDKNTRHKYAKFLLSSSDLNNRFAKTIAEWM